MTLVLNVLHYSAIAIDFLPAIRFYKTKFFLFFLSGAVFDLFVFILTDFFHIHSQIFLPLSFLVMLLFLPNKNIKRTLPLFTTLAVIIPFLDKEPWLPFLTSVLICIYLLYFFLQRILQEIKAGLDFFIWHGIMFSCLTLNLVSIFLSHSGNYPPTAFSPYLLAAGIILIMLLTYVGADKNIMIPAFIKNASKYFINGQQDEIEELVPDTEQNKLAMLTDMEIVILHMIAKGNSNTKIAEKICKTIETINSHVKHIKVKSNIHDRALLQKFAFENKAIIQKKFNQIVSNKKFSDLAARINDEEN